MQHPEDTSQESFQEEILVIGHNRAAVNQQFVYPRGYPGALNQRKALGGNNDDPIGATAWTTAPRTE